jgi:hypothetical protein
MQQSPSSNALNEMKKKAKIVTTFLISILIISCTEENVLPYSTYSSLLSQSQSDNPTEKVLFNDMGLSIEWTRIAVGIFEGKMSKEIDLNNVTIFIHIQESNRIATGGFVDSKTIQINALDRYNVYDTRDGFSNAELEIKDYR